ncbi:hypothetical protein TraAM80_05161 [Trypanosoma rangeli]|uniref:Uncharacterized protein n=1 Tax=Trypanosoma rangeli TaxID=5698 RepID=A0A422NG72_TRYRA|nr:uncharacterized protein TraAM80_05161 [Trypanosoma rangeli]RNF04446.1 hypothetical protein TraAM80_05161 [Trypanosoma rangeli]|eukprot:RNF04446.1 hypothetical protein TraAM80_05161 [Trypanosoma rangeli]
MTRNKGQEKRVSFAYALVTAVWPANIRKSTESNNSRDEGHLPSNLSLLEHGCLVHQTVDSLRLELELPLVLRYRMVEYVWQQCYRVVLPDATELPRRPSSVVTTAEEDAREARTDLHISSTSLRIMDGVSLDSLKIIAETALVLHPYSRRLDPVTRPIIAFLRHTCTLQLSRRQNCLIGLLPKLMEILILLCHCLERGALRFLNRAGDDDSFHNSRGGGSHSPSLSLRSNSLRDNARAAKATSFSHRCAWWLSRLRFRATPHPHRLFTDLKELLLNPGPLCDVKAMYLRHIAHRFFPQLPFLQRTLVASGSDDERNNELFGEDSLTQNVAEGVYGAKEPVEYSGTELGNLRSSWHNG